MPFSFAYIWWYDPRRNEDFHGDDVVALNASSRNGVRRTQFPTFVEPINDPSVILAPSSILLSGNESWEGYRIFDKNRDTFEFSIVDPDLHNFPGTYISILLDRSWCCLIMHCLKKERKKKSIAGKKSSFFLVLSLEVLEGTLTVTLPSSVIAAASMKTEAGSCWQPVQTYVTIANRFIVRGTAIRFRGSVRDCNRAMRQLRYYQVESS